MDVHSTSSMDLVISSSNSDEVICLGKNELIISISLSSLFFKSIRPALE